MAETIMPGFDRFPTEGNIIGRLLAGYGELEFELCRCVAAVTGDIEAAIRAMFKNRGELRRLQTAKSLIGDSYTQASLGQAYDQTMSDIDWCREIRNQFAHCSWYDTPAEGICIFDLEGLAKQTAPIEFVTTKRRPISLSLLQHQEAFFKYTQKCFWYLESEFTYLAARSPSLRYSMPQIVARPFKHD